MTKNFFRDLLFFLHLINYWTNCIFMFFCCFLALALLCCIIFCRRKNEWNHSVIYIFFILIVFCNPQEILDVVIHIFISDEIIYSHKNLILQKKKWQKLISLTINLWQIFSFWFFLLGIWMITQKKIKKKNYYFSINLN